MPKHERSPTLATVFMVELAIKEHSGELTKTQVWKSLPKKVMWQTYCNIVEYLEEIDKIAFDEKGLCTYIWNPTLARQLRTRQRIRV